jgi:hypothetical protein
MQGATPPVLQYASLHGAQFNHRDNFTFTFTYTYICKYLMYLCSHDYFLKTVFKLRLLKEFGKKINPTKIKRNPYNYRI